MVKRLLQNGENTGILFDGNTSDVKITKWVGENLNQFKLNEEHSCSAEMFNKNIQINGDEDFVEITIVNVLLTKV